VCSPREMHEDNSLTERPTTIEVLSQVQEQEEEEDEDDIISGNAVNIAPNMTPRHKRLQQVGSASPNLSQSKLSPGVPLIPLYNSPASSSSRPVASPSSNPLSSSPSVEEMEKMLGINADSPGAQDFFDTTAATASSSTAVKKPVKKSIRRTTMLTSEIFDGVTLADIRKDQQSLAMGNPNRRRSSRVERIYYGSPSNVGKAKEQEQTSGSQFKHPLMVKENWKVLAGRQKTHNNNILTLLNTANIAMLTKLPAVGPKSAFVIQQYRDLHDGIKTIEELKDIPGLAKTFYNKFCVQNQVKEVPEEEEQQQQNL